jgi:hypothetical protein
VDQAVYNFILNQPNFWFDTLFTDNNDDWAIQLGTTLGAVKSGKGDLGMMFKNDPSSYEKIYHDVQTHVQRWTCV